MPTIIPPRRRPWYRSRFLLWGTTALTLLIGGGFLVILEAKTAIQTASTQSNTPAVVDLPPFPIGVDPIAKVITEDPAVEEYVNTYVASNHTAPSLSDSWLDRTITRLAQLDWYQNLATPATRILVVQSGERHEEIARNIGRILRWTAAEKSLFIERIEAEVPYVADGTLYPGRYVVAHDAGPEEVAVAIAERFHAEVRTRYTDELTATLPLKEALIVASLIEREAYDFNDMRYISGVIWNRLFIDMKLQIDATLQYARGAQSAAAGGRWWPVPTPQDKYLTSPFNTYQHAGLPPSPISNPSIDAIIAALNPRETDCLFYYHTDDGSFYCNATYEAHVAGLKQHFGQGR